MEGTQKPKHFTTPGDHVGLGVLSLQEQRQKEQQVEANVLWGHTRDESSWKEWTGGLARYFLRFRRGDNILVDFNTPPWIWLIMSHSQNQEKWEKTTFQILREDHIPDAQRRPHSRSPEKTTFQILKTMFQIPDPQRRTSSRSSEKTMFQILKTMFQIPDPQRRPYSKSSEKTTFQIFKEDHVPELQRRSRSRYVNSIGFESTFFLNSRTHRPL